MLLRVEAHDAPDTIEFGEYIRRYIENRLLNDFHYQNVTFNFKVELVGFKLGSSTEESEPI